jgi:lipopolysaccharide export system permease protein
MFVPFTISFYLARQFLLAVLVAMTVFSLVTGMIETMEMLRRTADNAAVSFTMVVELSAMKTPMTLQTLLPFVGLFASVLTFWRLTRSSELTVIRGAGVSVWQFMLPVLMISVAVGAIKVTVISPLASSLYSNYLQQMARLSENGVRLFNVTDGSLWLLQSDEDTNSFIHAPFGWQSAGELKQAIMFYFDKREKFVRRIDATSARLEPGHWTLTNAWTTGPDQPPRFEPQLQLPTELTADRIQESFAPPDTISFWELPGFIRELERAGFSTVRHRLTWHRQLVEPLLMFAMVMIGATYSLRLTRRGGTLYLVFAAVLTGLLLHFATTASVAFGRSEAIPVVLAAWTPALMVTLLGISLLLHLEDG